MFLKTIVRSLTVFAVYFLDEFIHLPNIVKILKNEFKNNKIDILFDVGAHKGVYLQTFKKKLGFKLAYGFEPNQKLYETYMKKNKSNIFYINSAVSDYDGELQMVIDNDVTKISSAATPNYNSKTYKLKELLYGSAKDKDIKKIKKVKCTSLDTFIKNNNVIPDFLKIDVEGLEYNVLLGLTNNLNEIRYIMLEHHYDELYDGENPENALNLLNQNNFKLVSKIKFPFMNWEDRIYKNIKYNK